jgi:hypothetical protein
MAKDSNGARDDAITPLVEFRSPPAKPKYCRACKTVKPATKDNWIDFHPTGEPIGSICRYCKIHDAEWRLEKERKKNIKAAIGMLVTAAKNGEDRIAGLQDILAELFTLRGGIQQVAKDFWEDFDECRQTKPGSQTILNYYTALFKMMAAHGSSQRRRAEELTDTELASELTDLMSDMAASHVAISQAKQAANEAIDSLSYPTTDEDDGEEEGDDWNEETE